MINYAATKEDQIKSNKMKRIFSLLWCILCALIINGQNPNAIKKLNDSLCNIYDTYKEVTSEALIGTKTGEMIADASGKKIKIGEYNIDSGNVIKFVCYGYYRISGDSSNITTTIVITPYSNLSYVISFMPIVRKNKITDSVEVSAIAIMDGEGVHLSCGIKRKEKFIDGSNDYLEKIDIPRAGILVIKDNYHAKYFSKNSSKIIFYTFNK